jgi:quercetin dioxygenase-like cupin family protein
MAVQQVSPRHVLPGEGETYDVLGNLITIKATGENTGGAYSLFDARVPSGVGSPPHYQKLEEESFFVLEGEFTFHIGEETTVLGPGGYAMVPRGTVHAFTSTGEGIGRMVIMTTPGGYHENFFKEGGELVFDPKNPGPGGPPDFDKLMAAAQKWGVEIPPPPVE